MVQANFVWPFQQRRFHWLERKHFNQNVFVKHDTKLQMHNSECSLGCANKYFNKSSLQQKN